MITALEKVTCTWMSTFELPRRPLKNLDPASNERFMARQKRVIGDVVEINLGDGKRSYARVLPEGAFAFYDCVSTEELNPEEVISRPILFIVGVMKHAVTSGRWRRVKTLPLEKHLVELPPEFIQDPIDPTRFRIYQNGKARPATREECEGLERAAAWDPTHVEDRLLDHYAAKPNKWVESMKIR
jgi:hypothetical protein